MRIGLGAAMIATVAAAWAGDTMILTEFDGSVLRFDVPSRTIEQINASALSNMNAATAGPGGTVYTTNFTGNNLYLLDPATGLVSFLAAAFDIRGLAYNPSSSTIYAIRDGGTGGNDQLYTVNPYTGAQALVGSTGITNLQSLTQGPDGVMYGYSVTAGMGTINLGTGLWTDLDPGTGGSSDIQAIESDSEGTIWGFGTNLYTVSRTTGGATLVQSGISSGIRGAALLKPKYFIYGSETGAHLDIAGDSGAGFAFATSGQLYHGSATAPNRKVYVLLGASSPLLTVDPGSGVVFLVGNTFLSGWTAMAYQPSADRMLAIRRNAGVDILYAIHYGTGVATLIGTTGTNTIEGLAVAPTGTVYGWSTSLGLMTINPATGAASDVNASVGGTSSIRSLDFSPDGRLCGFGNGLWDINTAGRFLRVGGSGYTQAESAVFVPSNGRMRGIDFGGSFWDIFDIEQGNGSLIAATSPSNCLTVGPDGSLYGQSGTSITRYDTMTGAATNVTTIGFSLTGLTTLGTTLYGIRGTSPNDTIYKFEPPFYTPVALPMSNLSGLQGLATSPNGTLFAWDVLEGLVRIDPVTGQATDVNTAAAGTSANQTLEFTPDFQLYGARDSYFDYNPATGTAVTFPGGPYTDIRGLAYVGSRVRGFVALLDYVGPVENQVVTIEVRHPNSPITVETHRCRLTPVSGNTGQFSFTSYRQGVYRLFVKGSHWLRRTSGFVNEFEFPDASNVATTVLENGDVDGDNEVAIGDYAQLSSAFGSVPGDPHWNPEADLNGDGEVDIGDYAILSANFGMTGDN